MLAPAATNANGHRAGNERTPLTSTATTNGGESDMDRLCSQLPTRNTVYRAIMVVLFWVAVNCIALLFYNGTKFVDGSSVSVWTIENNTGAECMNIGSNGICLEEVPRVYYTVLLISNGTRARTICTSPFRFKTRNDADDEIDRCSRSGRFFAIDSVCYTREEYDGITSRWLLYIFVGMIGGVVYISLQSSPN